MVQEVEVPPFHVIVGALQGKGMSQRDIADEVDSSQPFISDLARQEREQCEFPMGMRLYKLYARKVLGQEIVLVPVRKPRRRAQ